MGLKRAIIRNGVAFVVYLAVCSLTLRNHSGGADIFFNALMFIALLLHLIFILIKTAPFSKNSKKSNYTVADMLIVIALGIVFFMLNSYWLALMWWLTV